MNNKQELTRYSRQLILPQIGVKGQECLLRSKVLVIGAGALGSPVLAYLASAGVGTIGIVDGDEVDLSNLQRQFIHYEYNIGKLKTRSAVDFLKLLNSQISINEYPFYLNKNNAEEIIKDYDVVVNCTDNFSTRYLVNDCCVLLEKPLIDASIVKYEGQATVFSPGKGCYRCLYPVAPSNTVIPNCSEVGVIGPLAGIMGSLQAIEVIKLILNIGDSLAGKLITFDLLTGDTRKIAWGKNPNCQVCGNNPTITSLNYYDYFCEFKNDRIDQDFSIDINHCISITPEPRVIDLREELNEFPPLPNSMFLTYEEVLSKYESWDKDSALVFVCEIGLKSSALTELLRKKGFTKVFNLRGGIIPAATSIRI